MHFYDGKFMHVQSFASEQLVRCFSSYLCLAILLGVFDSFRVHVSILLGVFDIMRVARNS